MEIYLIRHGQMTGDPHEFYQPPVEGCLSALGLRHAEALADALADVKFDAIYSSPLGRAVQTAQGLAERQGVAIGVLPWLREWIPATVTGEADDTQFETIMEAAGRLRPEQAWKTPAGEGTHEMAGRIVPGFLKLLDSHGVHAGHGGYLLDDPEDETRIALFAHGGSLGLLLGFILGVPLRPHGCMAFQYTGTATIRFHQRVDVWYPVLSVPPPYRGLPV